MKRLTTLLATFALSAAFSLTASARDSFNIGINIGGYGFAPPPVVQYYPRHSTIYYGAPTVYYAPPVVRYAPIASFQYFNGGNGFNNRGNHFHGNRGWDRGRGGNRSWNSGSNGNWNRGGNGNWNRGRGGNGHHHD